MFPLRPRSYFIGLNTLFILARLILKLKFNFPAPIFGETELFLNIYSNSTHMEPFFRIIESPGFVAAVLAFFITGMGILASSPGRSSVTRLFISATGGYLLMYLLGFGS